MAFSSGRAVFTMSAGKQELYTHAHTGTQRGLKHTLVNIHTMTMAKSQFTGDDQEHTFEYVVRQYARF